MWTKFAIIAILMVLFICTVYFSSSKRKEKLFLKYNKSFGKEPQNYNKEADIEFLKDFYKARKENENKYDVIDEITWKDRKSTRLNSSHPSSSRMPSSA